MRRTNHDLSTQVAALLRRLTAHGLTRDQTLAEDLIRDLDMRLCPSPPHVDGGSLSVSRPGPGRRQYDPRSLYRDRPQPPLPAHPYGGR